MAISTIGPAALSNSGVTAGSYGSASAIPAITVDATGRITSATTNAFSNAYSGSGAQFFTSSGTFTVPAGVTAVKVTLVGGGGGGGSYYGGTITSGGTTSFGAYCSATGGGGNSQGAGGVGTGDIVFYGTTGGYGSAAATDTDGYGGSAGAGRNNNDFANMPIALAGLLGGNGGVGGYNPGSTHYAATGYGNGGWGNHAGGGGGGGGAIKWVTGLTPGSTIAVTIGAGGSSTSGQPGTAGACLVEW